MLTLAVLIGILSLWYFLNDQNDSTSIKTDESVAYGESMAAQIDQIELPTTQNATA